MQHRAQDAVELSASQAVSKGVERSFELSETQLGCGSHFMHLFQHPLSGFTRQLRPISDFLRNQGAAVEMCADTLRHVPTAPWAEVRADIERGKLG